MKYFAFATLLLLAFLVVTPVLALDLSQGIVPCVGWTTGSDNCNAQMFFKLVENFIQFCVFYLAAPLTTVAIAYAGINMALHPDNPATIKEGKKIVQTAVIGLIWALGAYLIVTTLVGYFIDPTIKGKIQQYITIN